MTKKNKENVSICLTMIIKNESKIILRCLNSVKDICDYMTICDTGSTDNTRELVNEFFEQNKSKFKGILYSHEWKNFGYNRSLSLDVAKKTGATYILTIDADMIMTIKPGFKKKKLKADSYRLAQQHPDLFYYNTRIMHTKFNWKCVGVTHEYYDADRPTKSENLDTLLIIDMNDGGSKSDKFERDIKLLTQGLIDEPNNVRYMFYLAQTYTDIGDYNKGLEWYTKRIKAGGWFEEVYYSYYKIGSIKQLLKAPWQEIETAYMNAWKFLPSRAEPLYELAKYCRNNNMHEKGYKYAKLGSSIKFPHDQVLFISQNVYKYEILDELAICAYYIGKYKECIHICDKLIKDGIMPSHHYPRLYQNISFAKTKLDELNNIKSKKKVVFYVGYSMFDEFSTYGSELALINLVKELTNYYDVTVFGKSCNNTKIQDVLFLNSAGLDEYLEKNEIEVMIISRYIHYFMEYPLKAKKTYVWLHDVCCHSAWNGYFLPSSGKYLMDHVINNIDGIICLTQWHKQLVIDSYGFNKNKVFVIGNGINESLFSNINVAKVPKRFIYTSDVSRGLEQLVDYFQEIHQEFPDAELYIYRDIKSFDNYGLLLDKINKCDYIHYGGRIEQDKLMIEFAKTDIWLYPTTFTETYCMSALEAMRSGCCCITSDLAALKETVGNRGILISGDPNDKIVKQNFISEVRRLLNDDNLRNEFRNKSIEYAKTQTWQNIARVWVDIINDQYINDELYNQTSINLSSQIDNYIANMRLNKSTDFCKILEKYDSNISHNYSGLYNQLFEKYKDVFSDIFILGNNSSIIKGFYDYFQNSYLYGTLADGHNITDEHITIYPNDDNVDNLFNNINEVEFDLFIDDSNESKYDKNINYLEKFITLVRDSGFYIIQNIKNDDIQSFEKYANQNKNKYKYVNIIRIPISTNINNNNIFLVIK